MVLRGTMISGRVPRGLVVAVAVVAAVGCRVVFAPPGMELARVNMARKVASLAQVLGRIVPKRLLPMVARGAFLASKLE